MLRSVYIIHIGEEHFLQGHWPRAAGRVSTRFSESGAKQEPPLKVAPSVLLSPSFGTDAMCAPDVSVVVEEKYQGSDAFATCHFFRRHVRVKFKF